MSNVIVEIALLAWPMGYERLVYLCSVIDSLKSGLTGDCKFIWTCAAESAKVDRHLWFGEELKEVCEIAGIELFFRVGKSDIGSNLNGIFRRTQADYIFICQEDRKLTKSLDLTKSIQLLEEYPKVSAIWYDWLPPGNSSYGKVNEFWISSPTSVWMLADREMLVRRTFINRYGGWLENKIIGIGEMDINRRMKRFHATVAHPSEEYFEHIGDVSTVPFCSSIGLLRRQ